MLLIPSQQSVCLLEQKVLNLERRTMIRLSIRLQVNVVIHRYWTSICSATRLSLLQLHPICLRTTFEKHFQKYYQKSGMNYQSGGCHSKLAQLARTFQSIYISLQGVSALVVVVDKLLTKPVQRVGFGGGAMPYAGHFRKKKYMRFLDGCTLAGPFLLQQL